MRRVFLVLALLPGGCRGETRGAAPPREGVVRGRVKLLGPRPEARVHRVDGICATLHPGGEFPADDVVVDPDGYVAWAFVYVRKGLEGGTFPAPREPVVLDQVGCRFVPHVFGIMVGQELVVRNSDPLLHTVHSSGKVNPGFNLALALRNEEGRIVFEHPEAMIDLRCDLHPWMLAWVGVLRHPYYAVTDEEGRFEIRGLPPGRYTLEVWHEVFAPARREIDLDGAADVDFELSRKK